MILKAFWEYIQRSVLTGISNKVSTTRISSYLILGSILTTGLVYLLIDIVNAIIKWSHGQIFIISTEDLVFFGMILAHHLTLLGINKNAETKQYIDLINTTKGSKDIISNNVDQKQQAVSQPTTSNPTNTNNTSNTSEATDVPDNPDTSEATDVPDNPDASETTDTPDNPDTPEVANNTQQTVEKKTKKRKK